MVNVTCNGMRILVMFVDVYQKCDHLLFGFVLVYGHFVCRGHCVSQWTQVSVGFKFQCLHMLIRKTKTKAKQKNVVPLMCVLRPKSNTETCKCLLFCVYCLQFFNF